jgi:hypothetical protein
MLTQKSWNGFSFPGPDQLYGLTPYPQSIAVG